MKIIKEDSGIKLEKTIACIDDKRLYSVNICIHVTIITKIFIIFNLQRLQKKKW